MIGTLLPRSYPQVGMWDPNSQCWSTAKVPSVTQKDGQLAFKVPRCSANAAMRQPCAVIIASSFRIDCMQLTLRSQTTYSWCLLPCATDCHVQPRR